jgi:ribA/ribD-fused uncharacterized protein
MDTIITPKVIVDLTEFIDISKKDLKAEVECKLLSGKIQTKDVADRIFGAIKTLVVGAETEEHRLTFSYSDSTRVSVEKPEYIHKLLTTNSFKEIPSINVERKQAYFDKSVGKSDIIDVPEGNARFTLRSETHLRKDWEGNPNDPKAHVRMIHRKSFKSTSELFRIDFSMIKTRSINSKQLLRDMLKQPHSYELEIEFINKETKLDSVDIVKDLINILSMLSQAYYQTPFLLPVSDIQKYQQEFKMSGNIFLNPVTMVRRDLRSDNIHNISKGYTVTNKADGERSGLYVARDHRLIRITPQMNVTWTGITANSDMHTGDFLDGEYIASKNLFCIFDVYRFRNKDIRNLPLLKSDDDTVKNPHNSRIGCAKTFVDDLRTHFTMQLSSTPLRIETKLFLSGDGPSMEEAIQTILTTEFEYETDGLIFTPKASPVAPPEDRKGKTWMRVYKWKPPHMNTIDFLLKVLPEETFDPIKQVKVRKGELYVSRTPGDDIIYPRETMTGEYVPRKLPDDLQRIAETNTRIPSIFQPTVPRDPDAYQIMVEVNDRGLLIDSFGTRVDDNTVVECSFDIETHRWSILRTRYDKTYQYRVLREPQYGNDIITANNVWTSIHIPITESNLKEFISNPMDSTNEDDLYYRDDMKRCSRVFNDVYDFHNRIKEDLYKQNVKKDDTLLELAVGRAGDLNKWKRIRASKVVGVDISLSNITSPAQGAAVRYITDKRKNPRDYLPPCLFVEGDMTTFPLFEQEDKYMAILTGAQTGSTKYLQAFEKLDKFDAISCQFAMHYACETEETFRAFAKNIQKYGRDIFFGTCSDGKSIYSLLVGKKTQMFGSEKQMCGDYTKEYDDRDTWTEEFGMPVKVNLESFDKPAIEYLVPFEKVTQILEEHGYDLVESALFSELYSSQTGITLTPEQQVFSFLNRTFVFRRSSRSDTKDAETVATAQSASENPTEGRDSITAASDTQSTDRATDGEPAKPVKRKLRKPKEDAGPPPVLFHGADESKGEHRNFSNMSEHRIDVDGTQFPTVEHYFQAMKAKEFKDDEIYEKIVKAKSAKAAKALGKKVKNFAKEVWDASRDEIMYKAIRTKFVQHPELQKQLLATADRLIGEADARDTYWGIGTAMTSEKSKHPEKWRGQNRIGKILMELRREFQELGST